MAMVATTALTTQGKPGYRTVFTTTAFKTHQATAWSSPLNIDEGHFPLLVRLCLPIIKGILEMKIGIALV